MNNFKKIQETIKKLGLNGHKETYVNIYADHSTNGYTVGLVGRPDVLETIWEKLFERYDKGELMNQEQFLVETLLVALSMHYKNADITEKLDRIRKEIEQAKKANLN